MTGAILLMAGITLVIYIFIVLPEVLRRKKEQKKRAFRKSGLA